MTDPVPDPVAGEGRPAPGPEDFPKAGPNSLAAPGLRAVGTLLDGLLVLIPVLGVVVALLLADADVRAWLDQPDAARQWSEGDIPQPVVDAVARIGLLGRLLAVVAWVAYEVVAVGRWGRTLGAAALSYRVARLSDGRTPTAEQAALRALLPAAFVAIGALPSPVAAVISFGWVAVFLAAFSSPLRRGLHDLAAGTVVVSTR